MMMSVREKHLYTHLAGLLDYPKEDIKLKAGECAKALAAGAKYPPEALEELSIFVRELDNMPLDDLQGVYSYTFDFTNELTLDMGAHLFDGFKRANQLAALKAMYREHNFPIDDVSKGELPDRLPIVLEFLGFVDDEALRKNISETFLIIAIEKLQKNFAKTRGNIYNHLVNAIYKVLEKDVKEAK